MGKSDENETLILCRTCKNFDGPDSHGIGYCDDREVWVEEDEQCPYPCPYWIRREDENGKKQ